MAIQWPIVCHEMQTYEKLTAGYQPPPGTLYGLGLMEYALSFWLKNTSSLSRNCKRYPEFCKCESVKSKCKGHFQVWGHPGLDWASGMPFLGVISGLNMSFAMAFDSYHGFNSSMTILENTLENQPLELQNTEVAHRGSINNYPNEPFRGL